MIYKRKDENNGFHIDRIISERGCALHKAEVNEPCWVIDSVHGPLRAICNQRAIKCGADGKITPYVKKDYKR